MKMSTLKEKTISILNSNDKGIGNSKGLSDKILVSDLTVNYLNGVYTFTYQNESHKDAHMTTLLNLITKDKSPDYIERLFQHLGNGEFLNLNHGIVTSQTSVDRYKQFATLFSELGITRAESNGKGSKLHRLYCTPSPTIVDALLAVGIITHDVLTDNYAVVGLKVELPKDEK
jgi:hypothetical protein